MIFSLLSKDLISDIVVKQLVKLLKEDKKAIKKLIRETFSEIFNRDDGGFWVGSTYEELIDIVNYGIRKNISEAIKKEIGEESFLDSIITRIHNKQL